MRRRGRGCLFRISMTIALSISLAFYLQSTYSQIAKYDSASCSRKQGYRTFLISIQNILIRVSQRKLVRDGGYSPLVPLAP